MSTIQLPAGIISPAAFTSGNVYQGQGIGKTIIQNKSSAPFSYCGQLKNLTDVKVTGITFDGNGVEVNTCQRIEFDQVEWINARRTQDNHQAIFVAGTNSDLTLSRCKWRNCTQMAQVYGGTRITLVDFAVENCSYGYKHGMSGGKALTIRRGVFKWMRATMGLEVQNDDASIDGVTVSDIAYVEPELYADDSKNGNATAFSLPMWRASNVNVQRCFADGLGWVLDAAGNRTGERRKSLAGWRGLRVGFEVGGNHPVYTQNWARNLNDPAAITSSTQAQCYQNRVEDCLETWNYGQPANGYDAASAGSLVEHNDASVILPAQGGWSLVGIAPPTGGGGLPTPPTPTPPPAISTFQIPVKVKSTYDPATNTIKQEVIQ